jgi:hypothetical protein
VKSLNYVKNLVPHIKHPRRYYESDSFDLVDWNDLPDQFVCKVSHGSGGGVLVHNNAPPGNTLPGSSRKFGWRRFEVLPINFDPVKHRKLFEDLMKRTYGQSLDKRKPEWGYWSPEPKIIVEEFLSLNGEFPIKITCSVVNGSVEIIFADKVVYENQHKTEITIARYLPSTGIESFAQKLQVSKESVEELINSSILVAINYEYLRVDWLLADGGFFFNELTPYVGGGNLRNKKDPGYLFVSKMWRPKKSDYR